MNFWAYYISMHKDMQKSIKLFLLFCFISNSFFVAPVKAANQDRIRYLLERARARKNKFHGTAARPSTYTKTTHKRTQINEEGIGYLPADTSRTKEVIYERETIVEEKTVPKEKSYDDLVGQFNELFSETKTHVENKGAIAQQKLTQETQTYTNNEAVHNYEAQKPQVVIAERPKPAVHTKTTKRPEPVYIETKNETSQTLNQTETISNSTIEKVEKKIEAIEDKVEETAEEKSNVVEQIIAQEEEKEEASIEETKAEEVVVETKATEAPQLTVKTQAEKTEDHLKVIKKSLKSLEEDAWNEVKFNMGEALDYFDKERKNISNPSEIDKFYRITLAFLRFAEGGLELDQGDFADFEDAESHYLDSQDILEAVELRLNSNDPVEKELLKIIQTVKKYINEDIEYIEEMIDLS